MNQVFLQLKLLFSEPSKAVDNHPTALTSLVWSGIIWLITFALLIKNSLNPSIVSVSPVQVFLGTGRLESFLANLAVQVIIICVPFAIVLGTEGLKKLISNLAIMQIPALVMALFGFLYEVAFWPLYKALPVSGLQAKAAFDAVFLLYPCLLMLVYRYVLIWIVAVKAGANGKKVFLLVTIHLLLCTVLYFVGGVL